LEFWTEVVSVPLRGGADPNEIFLKARPPSPLCHGDEVGIGHIDGVELLRSTISRAGAARQANRQGIEVTERPAERGFGETRIAAWPHAVQAARRCLRHADLQQIERG